MSTSTAPPTSTLHAITTQLGKYLALSVCLISCTLLVGGLAYFAHGTLTHLAPVLLKLSILGGIGSVLYLLEVKERGT